MAMAVSGQAETTGQQIKMTGAYPLRARHHGRPGAAAVASRKIELVSAGHGIGMSGTMSDSDFPG
jgi:hypothetical protein